MATISEIKTKIKKANTLGRQNLTEKGVTVPETATTFEIMKSIADVEVGAAELDELEKLVDESEVLDSTEVSVNEKVEQLIDKAKDLEMYFSAFALGKSFDRNTLSFMNADYQFKTIPKLDLSFKTAMAYAFANPNIEYIDYYLNTSNVTNLSSCFYSTINLKWFVGMDTSAANSIAEFLNNSGIETIQEPFDLSNVTNANKAFYCNNLKNIKFVEETIKVSVIFTSSVLSAESIQSIIDGLAIVETAQTLTLNSAIVLTDEQKATINEKGWTLAQ